MHRLVEGLSRRGRVAATTCGSAGAVDGILEKVFQETVQCKQAPPAVYLGIDPTSDGLHVGHLVGVLALKQFQQKGWKPIAVVGGATGLIGDPSGRDTERQLLDESAVRSNIMGLQKDLARVLDFQQPSSGAGPQAILENNLDWFQNMSALDLLRDVGKHFRIATMLGRESVKSRLGRGDEGMSFTEFSYQLLQGYDFLHLYRKHNCRVQIGGSDQWGNIVSGVDLIRRVESKTDALGLTVPLLTTKSGQKLGKSSGNAVWLNPEKTSDYLFYQYFIRTEDSDVEDLLLKLTDLDEAEIVQVMSDHRAEPFKRGAQKVLAREVMTLIRGKERLSSAITASQVLFGGSLGEVDSTTLIELARDSEMPSSVLNLDSVVNQPLVDLAYSASVCKSRNEAKRLVASRGLYINNRRVESVDEVFDIDKHAIDGKVVLVRSGKRNYVLVVLE